MTTHFRSWIGDAPTHWRHGRLKNLIASATNGVWGDDPRGDDTDVNCVRAADFDRVRQRVSADKLPRRQVNFKAVKKHKLHSGDLILEKSGGGEKQPVGAAVLFDLPETAVCSNFCSRVVAASGVESRFLAYAFSTAYNLGATEVAIKQTTGIQNLDSGALFALLWAYPEGQEQCHIADFLDAETARIDHLVAARERQRTIFEERIFAETSETLIPGSLTGSLGKLPWTWLPRIPKDGPLVRLGYVCRLQNGLTVDGKRDVSGDVVTRPYLRVANVQAGRVALDTVTEITVPRAIAEHSTLRPGDVLMTEGGDIDKLGRGTVWNGELDDCLHQNHIFAIRPNNRRLDGEYLAFMTQSIHGRCYFESTGVKTTNLASTNSSKILGFPIPLPPVEEQRAIVRDLRARTESSAHVMAKLERQLALLAERRQALITAAVTGQFDVTTARGGES